MIFSRGWKHRRYCATRARFPAIRVMAAARPRSPSTCRPTASSEARDDWVRVRVDMQLTMSQLYKSLTRLENEAPYVVVGYVSVVADRAVQTGHLATMDVRFEVSAPVRVSQPS